MKILLSTVFIIIALSCVNKNQTNTNNNLEIIPNPFSIQKFESTFLFSKDVVLVVESSEKDILFTANYLKEKINLLTGISIKTISSTENTKLPAIILNQNDNCSHGKNSYEINITKNNIIISGDETSLFYGVQSLIQIIFNNRKNENDIHIPTCIIKDKPRFAWRGIHLDESRHFFGVNEVKKILDLMAVYKLNVFHWHLTDDQGWRIEIKSHPELTDIGAWREGTGKEEWTYFVKPATKNKPKYGGYYTQEQIKEIIEYAQNRHITVLPEIELPGHSWAALSANPHLSCSGKVWQKPESVAFEFSDPFCAGNEQTFQFFDDVFSEIIDLFPSEYIHIGGDECKKTPWEHCPKCIARMQNENIKNTDELQSYFIKRIEKIVSSKGRKIIGWEEIMEGGLPSEAVVMSWKGVESGIKAAQLGYKSIMTPDKFTYLNRSQDKNMPNKIGLLTLDKVYSYNPTPNTMDSTYSKNIIGIQGALWSEYIYSDSILETQLLPRLAAISEVAWTDLNNKYWDNFLLRLENHFPMYDLMNLNYFIESPSGIEDNIFVNDKYLIELYLPYKSANIYYTTDGSSPNLNSKKYSTPFYITENTTLQTITVLPSGKSSKVFTGKYAKASVLPAIKTTNLPKGIKLKIYTGKISTLDDFSKLKEKEELIVDNISIPKNYSDKDNFGLEFSGSFNVNSTDIYTFHVSSDDGSRLYIDDKLIVDNDGIHGVIDVSGKVALEEGNHYYTVRYFQGNYGAELKVNISDNKDNYQQPMWR